MVFPFFVAFVKRKFLLLIISLHSFRKRNGFSSLLNGWQLAKSSASNVLITEDLIWLLSVL